MKRISGLMGLLLMLSVQVMANKITLKNGDRVTGKIIKTDGDKLLVATELLGDVALDFAAVTAIDGDQPLYVTLADGRTVSGVLTASADKAELRAANANVLTLDRSNIQLIRSEEEHLNYERSLNPGLLEGWTGGADVGLALTSGNSDTTNFAVGLAMTRTTLRDKTSIYAASVYNRDSTSGDSRTIANTVRGGVRYDHDINRKFFGYGFTDLEHNGLQDLSLRLVIGGGLGYHAIRNDRTQLDLLAGLAWNREYFRGNFSDRSSAEAQFGQTLTHALNSRVSLNEQLFIFPNLSNGGEYRINFDAGLVMSITSRIGWQLTLSNRYLSNPPPGLEKNDLLLSSGLKIKLGELK
jgi:putative salt-induced outer membrane protein YdiY